MSDYEKDDYDDFEDPKNDIKANDVKLDNHPPPKAKVTTTARVSQDSSNLRESKDSTVIKPIAQNTKRGDTKKLMKSKDSDDYDNDEDFDDDVDDDSEPKKTVIKNNNIKAQNRSHAISPKASNKFTTRQNKLMDSVADVTDRSSIENERMNRSMVSGDEMMGNVNRISMRAYLKRQIKLNPLAEIEEDLLKAKEALKRVKKTRSQSESADDTQKRLILLNRENILLRDELKGMNNNLNKFIDLMKEIKNKKKVKTKRYNRSVCMSKEEKLKAKGAEKLNYTHMTENMTKEHKRLKKRLDVVGDPSYSLQLRKKVIDIKEQIHILEEEKRRMLNEKFVRERKINKVIMAGQNDAMQETQERVKELTVLFDRSQKLNKKLDYQETTQKDANRQLVEIQDKLAKMESDAESKGINLEEVYKIELEEEVDVSKDPRVYERKAAVIQQAIDTNKYVYVEAMQEKNSIVEKIKVSYQQITDKRKEVNELMVKSKMLNEEETAKQGETTDDTLNELPAPFDIDNDETVSKLNDVIKTTNLKSKIEKAIKNSSRNDEYQSQSKVPSTKNAFTLRKKGAIPTSDNEDGYNVKKSVNKSIPKVEKKKFELDDDEVSIKNESESKPMYY